MAATASTRPDGSPARLLVVDDEESLIDLLGAALRFAGYEVHVARRGSEALQSAADLQPDLIVLDVNLPDIDGFAVCRNLRRDGDDVPVIFLTARDDPSDLRAGFAQGGDDFVTKPFSLEELNFRIQAILRRRLVAEDPGERLACGDLTMDVEAHVVRRGGREIDLSPTEFRLLRFLLLNRGRVLSKAQILDHVWQYDFGGDANVVETYISYLRRKIDSDEPRLIHTVRGFGYALRPSENGS
jgi:two-component system, OmpR family, response regulator